MIIGIKYKVLGGHTHFRMYAGEHSASAGLCTQHPAIMRNDEFEVFRSLLEGGVRLESFRSGPPVELLFVEMTDEFYPNGKADD